MFSFREKNMVALKGKREIWERVLLKTLNSWYFFGEKKKAIQVVICT